MSEYPDSRLPLIPFENQKCKLLADNSLQTDNSTYEWSGQERRFSLSITNSGTKQAILRISHLPTTRTLAAAELPAIRQLLLSKPSVFAKGKDR